MHAIDRDFDQQDRFGKQSQVCGQCHVEYYFQKDKKNAVKFPWDKGVTVDQMEKYSR